MSCKNQYCLLLSFTMFNFSYLGCSNQQINSVEDQVRNSGSSSPSGVSSENQSHDKKDSSGVSNAEDFSDMGLVHNSSSLTAPMSHQHQESTELPNFSVSFIFSSMLVTNNV